MACSPECFHIYKSYVRQYRRLFHSSKLRLGLNPATYYSLAFAIVMSYSYKPTDWLSCVLSRSLVFASSINIIIFCKIFP